MDKIETIDKIYTIDIIENKSNNDLHRNSRKFYWKFVVYHIRMIMIYFVCKYLFIPKKNKLKNRKR